MLVVEQHGDALRVAAPAKINVGLRLLGKRPDGYHEIESLVMAVNLTDTLEAVPTDGSEVSLSVRPDGADAPQDESNLVVRAARLLQQECGCSRGGRVTLTKRIPSQRGLGGGSSDAAAALVLLSRLWDLDCSTADLAALAAQLGSDVPFFLNGPLAIMRGRGERIEPLDGTPDVHVVLVVPPFGLPTGDVYGHAKLPLTGGGGTVSVWAACLMAGHIVELGQHLCNDLEPAAQALNSNMARLCSMLKRAGAVCVSMTGSGSALYALANREEEAWRVVNDLDLGAGVAVHMLTPWHS